MINSHDNEDGREDAGEPNPSEDGQLSEGSNARKYSRSNGGDQGPDDAASFAVGEDLETLRQPNKAGASA